ncbi:ABC transporter ATP-binding protein [Xanthobacter sp. V3C-3]|uniref:ABC transporter ATP-binding protein n=1 Tax=Xanthobacter lutulentifluminis TaxID=3119935 RepID=UPI00372A605F
MLRVSNFTGGYRRGVAIIEGISFDIGRTPVTSIVGSNGAGKTTLLRGIGGLLGWHGGEIHFDGRRIDQLPAHEIARLGIRMVPSGRGTFPSMSVLENLQVGGHHLGASERAARTDREMQRFPRLRERWSQQAGMLSGGEQQMLAIARAMMSDPRLLILDEPSQGLAPIIVDQIFEMIPTLAGQNAQVLLVEQDVGRGLEVSEEVFVIEKGRVTLSGRSSDMANNDKIRESYLGLG